MDTSFDEKKALDLFQKKRTNIKKNKTSEKGSIYRRVNDTGKYRNNARNFQYDYEEDFYEPEK